MEPDFILGLDLGQTSDFSAFAVVERRWLPQVDDPDRSVYHYGVRFLKRWPLSTPYPAIVAEVASLVANRPLRDRKLAVDQTGVGAAVVDMLRQARPRAVLQPIIITAGHEPTCEADVWRVPKRELVGRLQVLLQERRLRIARLPERDTLRRELLAFREKTTKAGNDIYEAWRHSDHDDLILAIALPCWLGEQCGRPMPPIFVERRSRSIAERMRETSSAAQRGLFGLRVR